MYPCFNPFDYAPLPFYLPPLIFQQLSIHTLIFSTFTDVMIYDFVDALPFSFSFLPSLSSIE
jgi:hypothetical protein